MAFPVNDPSQSSDILRRLFNMGDANAPLQALSLRRQQAQERSPQGMGGMTPALQSDIAGLEEGIESDPMTQRYEDIGDIQSEGLAYNLPESQQMRGDAMERLLAPIRLRGELEQEQQRIASGGQIQAAQVAAGGRAQTAEAGRQGQLQRQRNQGLQQRAMAAAKQPEPWWFQRIFGAQTPAQEAEGLLAQQQFTEPGTGGGDVRSQVARALEAQGIDPRHVDAVMNDPAAMSELGF